MFIWRDAPLFIKYLIFQFFLVFFWTSCHEILKFGFLNILSYKNSPKLMGIKFDEH